MEQCHFDWESNIDALTQQVEEVLEQCHFDWESNRWIPRISSRIVLEQCHFDWESNYNVVTSYSLVFWSSVILTGNQTVFERVIYEVSFGAVSF